MQTEKRQYWIDKEQKRENQETGNRKPETGIILYMILFILSYHYHYHFLSFSFHGSIIQGPNPTPFFTQTLTLLASSILFFAVCLLYLAAVSSSTPYMPFSFRHFIYFIVSWINLFSSRFLQYYFYYLSSLHMFFSFRNLFSYRSRSFLHV